MDIMYTTLPNTVRRRDYKGVSSVSIKSEGGGGGGTHQPKYIGGENA